jgi:hypothetical protein
MSEVIQKKPRKPRTSKKKMLLQNDSLNNVIQKTPINSEEVENIVTVTSDVNENTVVQEQKVPKKRGRKPKGGKIIQNNTTVALTNNHTPNIILHLKCNTKDLQTNKFISNIDYEPTIQTVDNFQFENSKTSDLVYSEIEYGTFNSINKQIPSQMSYTINVNQIEKPEDSTINLKNIEELKVKDNDETQNLWNKLKELTFQLHTNTITDKKSACFWCTCEFDNPMILIPKYELNNTYQCYGCFCSPECASAFLFKESIDTSTKFERYHLLNHIYCKIYNYEKNIKPAPDPFYTLNKYYGNLSIQEYRKLLKNERLLLVVDKPLSRILPELHEDNDDMMSSGVMISTSSKFKLRRKVKQSKTEILDETFNLNASS